MAESRIVLFRRISRSTVIVAACQSLLLTAVSASQTNQPASHSHSQTAFESISIPDVALLNQDGDPVRFYTDLVKGKVVAVAFIFTTCTTICPSIGVNLSKLQKLLSDRVNLISVTIDPVTDTPERLKKWAAQFNAAAGWTLVTGPKADVDRLLKAMKVFTIERQDHAPIVLIGNGSAGSWIRANGLASPAKLAELVSAVRASSSGSTSGAGSRP